MATQILKPECYDSIFGTKIMNVKSGQLGLMIKTWTNYYADATIPFGTWVDTKGKRHDSPIDDLCLIDEEN